MKTHINSIHARLTMLLLILIFATANISVNAQTTAARIIGKSRYDYVNNALHLADSMRYGWWSNYGGDLDHNTDNWKLTANEHINQNLTSINWAYLSVYTFNASNEPVVQTAWQWDGSVYQYTNRYTDSFDTQGRKVQEIEEVWYGGAWVISHLYTDSFGIDGLLAQELGFSWDAGTSTWTPASIDIYNYNSAGLKTLYQRTQWYSSAWNNITQIVNIYDANNRMITTTTLDGSGNTWINDNRHSFQYDDSGNQTIYTFYEWNNATSTWKNVWRDLYTYNSNNKATEWIDQNYSTQWDNNYKLDYTYNTANLKDTSIYSQWNGTAWNVVYLVHDQYNAHGFVTLEKYQYWDGSAFTDSTRATTTRNSDDQTLNIVNETFTAGAWGPAGTEYRYYEDYTPVTGIAETNAASTLKAYPNPFIKNCVVEFNNEAQGENLIQVFDLDGKLVRQEKAYFPAGNNKWMFDGNNSTGEEITKGVYILKISNGQQSSTQKLLKI